MEVTLSVRQPTESTCNGSHRTFERAGRPLPDEAAIIAVDQCRAPHRQLQNSIVVLVAAALAACATEPPPAIQWKRVGPPVAQHQIDLDLVACRGSAQAQSAGIPQPDVGGRTKGLAYGAAMGGHAKSVRDTYSVVLFGCMADRGWLASNR